MRKLLLVLLVLLNVIGFELLSQTLPSTFGLSSGNYSFTSWSDASSAGTYPANMYFHRTGTQDPGLSIEMTTDYTSAYNLTSGTRINGMGTDGITFINTGTSGNLGAAVVAINTTDRTNIQVSWLGGTHTQTDGSRVYAIRLQYRIGAGSWTDVPGPVEYSSSGQLAGHTQNFGPTTLPAACDNQSAVYLRWKYYSVSGGSGTRPRLRLDEISITSSPIASNSITTGAITTPPFCVDASNSATGSVAYTSTGTYSGATFTAYLSNASGSFSSPTNIGSATVTGINPSGSISITIPAGTPSGTGYKIRINSNTPAVTGSESSIFEIINGAKNVSGQSASTEDASTVLSWTNPSGCYDEIMIVGKAGSSVSSAPTGDGTSYSANLTFGSGTAFDGGYVVYKGTSSPQTVTGLTNGTTYHFTFFTRKGTNWSSGVTTNTTPASAPTLTEVILPQYIQGLNGTNNNRIPFAYRLTFSNLIPNATYRYINQLVVSSDGLTTGGAGNVIFVNSDNTFSRTTSTSFTTAGQYGEFTTNASGSYTGWFISEPTGNTRFTPGNFVFVRFRLNDGAGGTSAVTYLTTSDSIKVINFGNTSNVNEGTGIRGNSFAASKDFVFLYDNISGTGRPIIGTFIENDGTSGGTTYVSFYQTDVDAISGAWGAIIPNVNANGVRRIERRLLSNGFIGSGTSTDEDGIWGGTVNTVNPTSGTTPLVITSAMAPLPVELVSFTASMINKNILLNWSTSLEKNNYGFEIERSSTLETRHASSLPVNWEKIGFVSGNGNSNSPKEYSYTDNSLTQSGKYAYRLKQIDTDGTFEYSKIVEVDFVMLDKFTLEQNYPNPFNPTTVISYQIPINSNVSLKLYDVLGNEVATLVNEYKEAGRYKVELNVGQMSLSSGIYFYKLQAGEFSQVRKMILSK